MSEEVNLDKRLRARKKCFYEFANDPVPFLNKKQHLKDCFIYGLIPDNKFITEE